MPVQPGVALPDDVAAVVAGASSHRTGGYSDWRMPTIKELYSLIQFNGVNGPDNMSTAGFVPFIDTRYFGFAYGSGDGTVTDLATALVWDREDSGVGLDWPGALAWVQAKNAAGPRATQSASRISSD